MWLGAQSVWLAWRYADGGLPLAARGAAAWSRATSFREGVLVNLLNPAIASFYLAVVPTFVSAAAPPGRYALLAACHVGMAFVCHSMWAAGLDRLGAWFHHPGARRALQAGTGVALLLLAARVISGQPGG
jgi:threonine/homoserine/homoserine lactone efflux protein